MLVHRFPRIHLLSIATVTSILSVIFLFLDNYLNFNNSLHILFLIATILLCVLFLYSRFPNLYAVPGIPSILFFLFGSILFLELISDVYPEYSSRSVPFEDAVLVVGCAILLYLVIRKKPLFRGRLIFAIITFTVSGLYWIESEISILLIFGTTAWVMSMILPILKGWRKPLEYITTPVHRINAVLSGLILSSLVGVWFNFAGSIADMSSFTGDIQSRSWQYSALPRVILSIAIVLGSLSKFLQREEKSAKSFRVYWWGATLLAVGIAVYSHSLLSGLGSLSDTGIDPGRLSSSLWLFLTPVLCIAITLWANNLLNWQWKALTAGSLGGTLLVYLWGPSVYALILKLFVPGSHVETDPIPVLLQPGLSVGVIILFLTIFLGSYWARPTDRKQALAVSSLTGFVLSLIVFISLGAVLAAIASQNSLYGVAYTRTGYDELGWTTALTDAVLYIFPWTYGTLFACLAIGMIPAFLIGLTWPVRRAFPIPSGSGKELPASLPTLLLMLIINVVIQVAVFTLLDDKIMNTADGVGLTPWWRPEWIMPLAVVFPSIMLAINISQLFIKVRSLTKSYRNTVLACLCGLILVLGGMAIWFVEPEYILATFLLSGIGIEIFRQGLRLWEPPVPAPGTSPHHFQVSLLTFVPTALVFIATSLPLTTLSSGLALITITAISDLRNVNAPPPGRDWLFSMLEGTWRVIPILSFGLTVAALICVIGLFSFFVSVTDPSRFGDWPKYMQTLRQRIGQSAKDTLPPNIPIENIRVLGWILLGLVVIVPFREWGIFLMAFLLPYLYFKTHPQFFRTLSWPVYIIAGILLLAGVITDLFSIPLPYFAWWAGLLVGPALAVLYRGFIIYNPNFHKSLLGALFLPAVGIFLAIYANYLNPVSVVENGVARFRGNRWETFGPDTSPLVGDRNYRFFKDSQERLWISGHFGPEALLEDNQQVRLRFPIEPLFLSEERAVRLSTPGSLLEGKGVYLFIGQANLYVIMPTDNGFAFSLPNRPIKVSSENNNQQGPIYGENATECPTTLAAKDRECPSFGITSAIPDEQGNIWAGAGAGIARLHYDRSLDAWTWNLFVNPNSSILSGTDNIVAMLADHGNNIWGLSSSGINVYTKDSRWINYSMQEIGLDGTRLQAIYEDTQQRIWIGSSRGIAAWSGNSWEVTPLPIPSSVYGFYEDSRHQVWALTTAGAMLYSNAGWSFIIDIPADPLWQNPFGISTFYKITPAETGIRIAMEDQSGNLWFGGPRGLLRYDADLGQAEYFYPSNSGLPSENVRDIQVDQEGTLWVSTYTIYTGQRSELSLMGLVAVFISIVLASIYIGYQHSPQYKALQIFNQLSARPQNLLPEIYSLFKDANRDQVLGDLARHVRSEPAASRLVAAFTGLDDTNQTIDKDKAHRILQALHDSSSLPDAKEMAFFYGCITKALEVTSILDIGKLPLGTLRSQNGNKISLTIHDSTPFEVPTLVDGTAAAVLEMLGKAAGLIKKYLQVENAQDRLGYIADSLGSVERGRRDAELTAKPEGYFLLAICRLWQRIINEELDLLSGHADLRVEFRTRQIRKSEEVTLMLSIKNTGSAAAHQIQISILPSEEMHLISRLDRSIEYLSAGDGVSAEFIVTAPPKGDIRIAGEITWADRTADRNSMEFADVIRFYETSEKFERIPNPYVVGHPVKSASLFRGREDVFEFILHNIEGTTQSRTLVLYGQRRTGKTSILYQLLGGRLGANYVPVLIDVQELAPGVNHMGDLFADLAFQIGRALRKAGLQPVKINEQSFTASPTRSFSHFLSEIENELAGRKMVLMFDEFELLEERITQGKLEPESLGYLRSLMQHRDDLIFLFTGTHKLEQMSNDYWSIFFNIALHQQVSFMETNDAIRLIREPVQGQLSIDDLVVEKILALTQGHPYFIQLLCWALVNYCNKKERNYATLNDFNEVLKEIVSSGEAYFAYIWAQTTPGEKIMLAALAESMNPGKNTISIQEIMDMLTHSGIHDREKGVAIGLLDNLIAQNILVLSGTEGLHYSYRVRLIGEWVKASKPLRYFVERKQ